MIENNSKMDFLFIDCMFCIFILREKEILGKKNIKARKILAKI